MKKDIAEALDVLQEYRSELKSIYQWAQKMGYTSSKKFSRSFLHHFGERPKDVHDRIWTVATVNALRNSDKETTMYAIARELGFDNDDCMYRFVKRTTQKPK
ncbi:MAG: hypothetical protein ED557_13630 [Balneola sp.]|nr:MAG: hypothetical protein ED557_13630 [Balneola sp.]